MGNSFLKTPVSSSVPVWPLSLLRYPFLPCPVQGKGSEAWWLSTQTIGERGREKHFSPRKPFAHVCLLKHLTCFIPSQALPRSIRRKQGTHQTPLLPSITAPDIQQTSESNGHPSLCMFLFGPTLTRKQEGKGMLGNVVLSLTKATQHSPPDSFN